MLEVLDIVSFDLLAQTDLNPDPTLPGGFGEVASTLISWAKGIGLVAGIGGLIVIGIMMMIGRRNRSQMAADGLSALPWIVGGFLLIGMSAQVSQWLFDIGDDTTSVVSVDGSDDIDLAANIDGEG